MALGHTIVEIGSYSFLYCYIAQHDNSVKEILNASTIR